MLNAAYDPTGDEPKKNGRPQVEGLELKRRVGLLSGVALIVGTMIGTGIFVTPGGILARSGSVGLALVMWTLCGVLSILGSLSYAELGTLIPKSGAEYAYFLDGFGPLHKFWGPLPAFLYSWITVLLLRPMSYAIGVLSFANYAVLPLIDLFGLCLSADQQAFLIQITGTLCLCLITALNCYSVNLTLHIQNLFTVAKLSAIAAIIGCGIYQLAAGNTQHLATGFQGSILELGTVATAFYGGLYTYDGWNNLNYVTEELKNPYVNLPRSIMIGIPLVTVCYLALNVAYLTVLSTDEIIESKAVAVDFANYMLGPASFLIPVAVALSAFGSVLSAAFSTSRLCYVSAREGHLIDVLSYVHVHSRSPSPALLFTAALSLAMIFMGDIGGLIDFFSFAIWIFYVLAMVVLLMLRKTKPDAPRPYKVPIWAPIVVAIVGSYLVVAPLVADPAVEYFYVAGVLFVGFVVYIPFVYYKLSMGCLAGLTTFVQLLLNVAPTKMSLD